MKNYKRIPFNKIRNIESYVEKKLKEGHIIIQILVNEDKEEIDELISYGNDKECRSYYRCLTNSDEQLRTCIIRECMQPYYAFKDKNRDSGYCDIDIDDERQDVISFYTFKKDFSNMKKYYKGENFCFKDGNEKMHYEFYISTGKADQCNECDVANLGGYVEVEFATEWMTERGYYSK